MSDHLILMSAGGDGRFSSLQCVTVMLTPGSITAYLGRTAKADSGVSIFQRYITAMAVGIISISSIKAMSSQRRSAVIAAVAKAVRSMPEKRADKGTVSPAISILRHVDGGVRNISVVNIYNVTRGDTSFRESPRDYCQYQSSSLWITRPERSFGSNHVVFGGIIAPVSAMFISCSMLTG